MSMGIAAKEYNNYIECTEKMIYLCEVWNLYHLVCNFDWSNAIVEVVQLEFLVHPCRKQYVQNNNE